MKWPITCALFLSACIPQGGQGAPSLIDEDKPAVLVTTSAASSALNLGEQAGFDFTVEANGFSGALTLAAAGVPASWQATFSPATLDLVAGDTADVHLSVVIPSNGAAGTETLTVEGTAGDAALSADVELTVADVLIVPIATGTGNGAHVFPTRAVNLGTLVKFVNNDATPHAIHSGAAAAGFPHQEGELATGDSFEFTFTVGGSFSYYCHKHLQPSGTGTFNVQ